MIQLLTKIIFATTAFASDGPGHTHGSGGENEHLYPILILFVVLIILGIVAGKIVNKKK